MFHSASAESQLKDVEAVGYYLGSRVSLGRSAESQLKYLSGADLSRANLLFHSAKVLGLN